MKKHELQKLQAQRRARRVRAQLHGTAERPRLSVARSNRFMFIQAIDDDKAVTIVALSDQKVKGKTKTDRAAAAAKQLAKDLQSAGITKLIFDRGSRRYHGRVKAVAQALREAGIEL